MPDNLKKVLKNELLHLVTGSVDKMLSHFFEAMPESYFDTNDKATVLQHLSALLLANISGNQERIMLENQDATRQTYIHFGSYPGLLSHILDQIPSDKKIQQARAYTSNNNELIIDVFDFSTEDSASQHQNTDLRQNLLRELSQLDAQLTPDDRQVTCDFIHSVNENYLSRYSLSELLNHALLTQQVRNTLDSSTVIQSIAGTSQLYNIAYAVGQVDSTDIFTRLARYFCTQNIDIRETFVENFDLNSPEQRALVVLQVDTGKHDKDAIAKIEEDIRRLPYLDQEALNIAFNRPSWSLLEAEVIVALCHIADHILSAEGAADLSRDLILQDILGYNELTLELSRLAIMRFDNEHYQQFETAHSNLLDAINDQVADSEHAHIFSTLLRIVRHLLKANIYASNRYALAFKLAPEIMLSQQRKQQAYGVFYIFGKAFDGFHVRFEDIARGGVRIVQPQGVEQYAIEAKRLFDEAYQLASAQQLKNKDIPEGGSKGVILVKPTANTMRCGKSYVNSLLDLILDNEETQKYRKDYQQKPELLFLGPDENVSDALIEWVIKRAAERGYTIPNSFMSSKPGAGINHKEYGVTSEGVYVFLDVGLENIGINPKTSPFTIKITGGPDGDVAGNLIKILYREYGKNAIITGIADGSGCAEDQHGLDRDELLRLVAQSLTVSHFNKEKLHHGGRVLSIHQPGGVEARNTLHFRLQTDVFVPAGGRPATINESNAANYLNADKQPASKLIVEGANLFLTPQAREWLTEQGVFIVKDSSANKCGVICSSFEIAAGMILDEHAFLDIKNEFVKEVKVKLRALALLEAKTLFREFYFQPDISLASLSMQLSHEIITITDMVAELIKVNKISSSGVCQSLMRAFFPASLLRKAGSNALEKLPDSYFVRAMASIIASRIVYHEGIRNLQSLPRERLQQYLLDYLSQEEATAQIIKNVMASDVSNKTELVTLLERGATSTALKWQ